MEITVLPPEVPPTSAEIAQEWRDADKPHDPIVAELGFGYTH